jgi:hypothetical protein
MTDEQKNRINLPLLLPLGLLILEIIAVIVLLATGYEISGFVFYSLVFVAFFLISQISHQLWIAWQIKKGVDGIKRAEELLHDGKPLEAIKLWKKALLNLPRDKYLVVLTQMEKAYQSQEMDKAVQQIRAIQTESIEFFNMTEIAKSLTPKDRLRWRTKAFTLHKSIQALPVKKDRDLENVKPEE